MKTTLKTVLIALVCTSLLLLAGCGGGESKIADTGAVQKLTDVAGREVEIPAKVEKIIAMGPGGLRMVCYMQGVDKVVGVEEIEKQTSFMRVYSYVYPQLSQLPVVGKGGSGGSVAYEEEIIKAKPDVIIAAYDAKMADEVSEKTGIPVVVVGYKEDIFSGNLSKSFDLIGKIIGKEERAKELNTYLEDAKEDLSKRTSGIPDDKKPTVYTGAVSFRGSHGFDGTYGGYPPFVAINAKNVVDETGKKGPFMIDMEKILEYNPDFIFINKDSMKLVNEQYQNNPDFFKSLKAVQEKKVYSQMSYNWYTTNLEIALANTYYAGTILYPEEFKDIDIAKKTDEIFEKMLGKKLYEEYVEKGVQFQPLTIGE